MPLVPNSTNEFKWPQESVIENIEGQTMHISPFRTDAKILENATDNRMKECSRFYINSNTREEVSELEVHYWLMGGHGIAEQHIYMFLQKFDMFFESKPSACPKQEVHDSLIRQGLHPIVVEININWLIEGKYVDYDAEHFLISKRKK